MMLSFFNYLANCISNCINRAANGLSAILGRISVAFGLALFNFSLLLYLFQEPQASGDYILTFSSFWYGWKIWQPLTALFVHQGSLELGLNILVLISIGYTLEKFLGRFRFATLYAVAGIGALLVGMFVDRLGSAEYYGSAGALSGLLATAALYFSPSRLPFKLHPFPVLVLVIYFSAGMTICKLLGFLEGSSLTVFVAGAFIGAFYSLFARRQRPVVGSSALLTPSLLSTTAASSLRKLPAQSATQSVQSTAQSVQSVAQTAQTVPPAGRNLPDRAAAQKREKALSGPFPVQPVSEDLSSEDSSPEDLSGKGDRLFYDPQSGRFYFKNRFKN